MALNVQATNTHPKLYKIRGAQYCKDNGLTTFRVYAPNAKAMCVILTAYGHEEVRLKMQKIGEGIWEVVSNQAPPGRTYLYLVDDYNGKRMLRIDPVSFSIIDIAEARQVQSVVYDPTAFCWNDQTWMMKRALTDPLRSPLSIYEMQPKLWKNGVYRPTNYRQLAPELAIYCQRMGFTHIEVFGLLEHAYKTERGYQVTNFFAPYHDNASLHEFDGTNLHASDASCWGTLYLDYSKEETYRLLFASALYFLDELHIDGIRFDAVSQMIRRQSNDISTAIGFLCKLNETIHRYYPGVLSIAEETEGYPLLSQTMGFDMKWNIGWCNDAMNLLRTPYCERSNHWQEKVLNMLYSAKHNHDKMILTLSHDDTDCHHQNPEKSLLNCVSHTQNDIERFSDVRNFFGWQTFGPSRGHMIHMGDKVAQPVSWYHRFRHGLSSIDWSLSESATLHGRTQEYIADLNKFYRYHPQFWQNGEQDFEMIYEYKPNLIVAYHRGIYNQRRMAIIHNFSNRGYQSYHISLPMWDPDIARIQKVVEIFNSDNPMYGGSGSFHNENITIVFRHGRAIIFRLTIPPLATLVLEEQLN
ncbi:unnamed protein product [Adineta steineri]|uniref:1,4-alpha-glucan branching enzyme n=1 Tax=Adineta steineri TaxID=433720 RepID=A0A815MS58_9BILA|nr:unnamed protein product [Adineta steineri]